MHALLLAALTVASPHDLGCADRDLIVTRLRAIGIASPDSADVHVRFFAEGDKRVVEIGAAPGVPGAAGVAPRRIEHQGSDCASLTDAAIALLSVLLDEIADSARRDATPPAPPETPRAPPHPALRLEAAALASNGVVADVGLGVGLGAAWRPVRWGNVGVVGEVWPERDHGVREGRVSLSAWTIGLAFCAGRAWPAIAVEGCAIGHGGLYALSAAGFAVVRPVDRGLLGGEVAARIAIPIVGPVGLFVRAGVWVPVTRIDVTVRGADTGFATTTIGPKAAFGLELLP